VWVKRNFRLTRSDDFKRVRSSGKSYAHPLVVLVVTSSEQTRVRVGLIASQSVGGAVQRNRAKRLLREAVKPYLPRLRPTDLLLIARTSLAKANLVQTSEALTTLFNRAKLLIEDETRESSPT
jgi:ribonuclease P protein component